MSTTNTSKYTYTMFASDVLSLVNGEIELTPELSAKLTRKANDLLAAQATKAAYNATHKDAKHPKGASEETMARATAIRKVLTGEPMTAAEISAAAGVEFTALQVANAARYIEGVKSGKVVRETVNIKGLRSQKEYTGYYI